MSAIALLKNLLHLMNICNCCCEIVKVTHSPLKNGISVSAFVHLTQNIVLFKKKKIIATSSVE